MLISQKLRSDSGCPSFSHNQIHTQHEQGCHNSLSQYHYVWIGEWTTPQHHCTSSMKALLYHALALVFLPSFMAGLLCFLRGSMKQDTFVAHVQLLYLLENTADSSACSSSFKGCSGILPGHLNTKLNALCTHKTCIGTKLQYRIPGWTLYAGGL